MIHDEADLHDYALSETMSVTSESSTSSYRNYEIDNNGGTKARRTVTNLRSIKLAKLPSVRLRPVKSKIYSDSLLLNQVEMSDASPNYMNTTTSSTAKDNLQKSARTLTRRSSFVLPKSLSRLRSTRFRRPLTGKFSGGSDLRKNIKKSKSIKLRNRSAIDSSDAENAQFQASVLASKSSLCNADASNKSLKVISRASSKRPLRMLKKMASLRTNRSYMKKSSHLLKTNLNRATCSSTLKDSKFHNRLEIQSGEGISTMKVCPYRYCSLHGHQHSTSSPLKRFVSMRRRLLKSQRSIKPERQSSFKAKRSSNVKKVIRGKQASSLEPARASKVSASTRKVAGGRVDINRDDTCDEDGECSSCSGSVIQDVVCEFSAPLVYMQEDFQIGKLPMEERHAIAGEMADGSAKSDSPTDVFTATEQDDIASTNDEILETERVHHDTNEDKIFTLSLEVCGGDSGLIASEENSSTAVVSRAIDSIGSAPISEQIEDESAAREEKNEDYFSKMDSKSDCNTAVVDKTQMGKQKHMGLWNVIYKHMAFGIVAEAEVQVPDTETDKEEGEEADTCPRTNKSGSSEFSGFDHESDVDYEKGGNIRLYQQNAIKLVKEAFDKILSEVPDQSSDSGSIMDGELSEINYGEGEELSISSSFNSRKENMAHEPGKKMLKADKISGPEGSKSKKQTPSNWSNLKKLIVLTRFVKALDKVRKFNPCKSRFLPVPTNPEAEKINLRHQTLEEKKNSEEWMLDYALQQVISALAPAQKRKVALLVQAFESVAPLPDTDTSPSSNSYASSHSAPVERCVSSQYQKSAGKVEETKYGISLRKTSFPDMRSNGNLNHVNGSCTTEEQAPDSCLELKELNLEFSCPDTAKSLHTALGLKENFGNLDLDNKDNDSIFKYDRPYSANLVVDGEPNITETTSPKLAVLANTSNDVQPETVVSDPEVHALVLAFNVHHEIPPTSNDLSNGEFSASTVYYHDFGFNNQHDIQKTTNNAHGNGVVSASEVQHLDLGFNDHDNEDTAKDDVSSSEIHDINLVFDDQHASNSNDRSNGEVSASEVRDLGLGFSDQHDVEIASYDVHGNGKIAASKVNDLDLGFNNQHNAANTLKDILANGEGSSEIHNLDLGFNDQHDAAKTTNDVLDGDSSSEVYNLNLGLNHQQYPPNPQIKEGHELSDDNQVLQTLEDSNTNEDVNSLVPVPEQMGKSSDITKGEAMLNNNFPPIISPREESGASSFDLKQKNVGLWYLIYKHMVSGTATLLDEAGNEEEQGSHMIKTHETNNKDVDHHAAGREKVDFQQIEAIRMVEEAIDEIPLPDSQDDSLDHDNPITSNIIPNQEHLKEQPSRASVHAEVIKSTALDPKEPYLDSDDTTAADREKNAFSVGNKTKQKPQKSWSNLKKMVLLRRFVKALEKVKEFNPRGPQFLPLESEKEAERVLLKHQEMEDRKNSDEWMLDYALQQVVAKLTPARKRKVQLLVEAFETVIPTVESGKF